MAHSSIIQPLEDTYESHIVSGEHGINYQKNLFLIIFERLTRKGYDFKLAYEMKEAGKFDDVVVVLKNANNGSDEWWFFQTKHSNVSKEPPKPLTYEMLFPKGSDRCKGNFSLYKYLVSFANIKKKFKGKKKVFIFTNMDVATENLNGRVEIVTSIVNNVLDFPGRKISLKIKDAIVKDMLDYINKDFKALKDAMVKLFRCGIVDRIIYDYKTPLADILEITNNSIRLKSTFTGKSNEEELNLLYVALKEAQNGIETAQLALNNENDSKNQISSIFSRKTKNKELPPFVDRETVKEFFNELVLSVNQPDDLRPILNADLQLWMKTWIRPDKFGSLETEILEKPVKEFEKLLENLISNSNEKPFLTLADGERCLAKTAKMFQQEEFCPFYINRRFGNIDGDSSAEIGDTDFARELTGKFKNRSCIILSAEPGMGKTTAFQYIAHEAQQMPNRLVYFVYLNELQDELYDTESVCDLEDALLLLSKVFSDAHCEIIRKTINEVDGEKMHIIIFFDAFDEIAVECRQKVLAMFEQLQRKSNVQIVIDGRRHVKELLEEHFKTSAMCLLPFDKNNQIDFLRKFWKVSQTNELLFKKYANQLLSLFHKTENKTLYEFTKLPLTLKMLAKVRKFDFKKYLKEKSVSTALNVGIIDLYESFVEKSFSFKMTKLARKWKLEDEDRISLLERFKLQHQLLAIEKLNVCWKVIKNDFNSFETEYNVFVKRIKNQTDKSSLVEVVNKQVQFVHLSYAEFLAAQFFYVNVEKFQNRILNTSSDGLENNPFGKGQFKMVRNFFFAIIETKQETKHLTILKTLFQNEKVIRQWVLEVSGCNTIKEMLIDGQGKIKKSLLHELLIEATKFYQVFKFLITTYKTEININYRGFSGETCLTAAAENGCFETVKLLIENQADINRANNNWDTPLNLALKRYHPNIVHFLIERSANLETTNKLGQSPFHIAILCMKECKHENESLTKVQDFSSTNIKKSSNHKSFEIATAEKVYAYKMNFLEKIFESMLSVLDYISGYEKLGNTLLHHAVMEGVEEAVAVLLKYSENVNSTNIEDLTPLQIAIHNKQTKVIKLLLEKSPDADFGNKNSQTPLNIAAKIGCLEAVELILQYGANVNAQDENQQRPIHLALENEHFDVFKMLLSKTEDINAADKEGQTLLHIAAKKGCAKAVELLLEHKANVNAQDENQQRPIHLALKNEHFNVFKMLLPKSEDINAADKEGQTLLHIAAKIGCAETVELLLDHKANVNAQDENQQRPIHLALENEHLDVFKILLARSENT